VVLTVQVAGNGLQNLLRICAAQPTGALPRTALQWRETWFLEISKGVAMIRKLPSGEYRLYSRKKDPQTGRRKNLGTFETREAAEKHERAVQYFKHHG
jgi:hypothetical protein